MQSADAILEKTFDRLTNLGMFGTDLITFCYEHLDGRKYKVTQGFANADAFERYIDSYRDCDHMDELKRHAKMTHREEVVIYGDKEELEQSSAMMEIYPPHVSKRLHGTPNLGSFGEPCFGWKPN